MSSTSITMSLGNPVVQNLPQKTQTKLLSITSFDLEKKNEG